MFSLVIPVYKNEANLPRLFTELTALQSRLNDELEVVFVIDGSPDRCEEIIRQRLPALPFRCQLISLSRNFGSFSAVTAGVEHGLGEYFGVIAADLQEPPELILRFSEALRSGEADIVFGVRASRSDPALSEVASTAFWWIYRRFVIHNMPRGGVDVFGFNVKVRDHLLKLHETTTNIVALLLWLGFRRKFIPYNRRPRLEGRSAWTLAKKLRYSINSLFNFTDLPIRILLAIGIFGTTIAGVVGLTVLIFKVLGLIEVPGYAAIVLAIVFFGGVTTLGLGIIGQYLWLTLQNARNRPNFVVASVTQSGSTGTPPEISAPVAGHTSE